MTTEISKYLNFLNECAFIFNYLVQDEVEYTFFFFMSGF